MPVSERNKMLITNLIKGLLWLLVIVAIIVFAMNLLDEVHYEAYLQPIYDQPLWVFIVFQISEIIFGIIPPEIFMLWSAQTENLNFYIKTIILFSILSYIAGIIGYFIGSYLNNTSFYHYLYDHFLHKYIGKLKKFGGFIIIVACLTPLPFSAIAMLVGAVQYPLGKYLAFSLFRFGRYILYSILIWHTNIFT